ncbi:PaaI family thioesterase [Sphingomonas endolithica]|uniref:PaaI family thioesterase n=1 Tax=Sphingomonas endolithica TaxID=2972485 RepID=UPI0021AE920D|nr:PaaI family thioesterase [Sphingomonas sp. ZFBP2030]
MLPPYAETLGLYADPEDAENCRLIMPFEDGVLGRPGFLHGGAISGLMEMAAIVALRHALADDGGGRIKPINVTVDFMRGGRDKLTYSRGIVTRLGNRVANVEATAWQDDPAKPIAAARMNYLVVRS